MRTMLESIAPLLGERIEQALDLYHRMHPSSEEGADGSDENGATDEE
jgi:hypothetical protein